MFRSADLFASVLGKDQIAGLDEDFLQFQEKTGSDDTALFAQYLCQQGLISHEQLIEILTVRGRPEVTRVKVLKKQFSDDNRQRTYATMSPAGAYALLGMIGEGSMGQILVGKDYDLKRKVAFKQMSEALAHEEGLLQRFVAEAQLTAQLDHPNIVPVYGLEVAEDGRIGYAMKLVEGETLGDVIDYREGTFAERLEHFLKVCDAVSYSHSRGVIHRDLKPDNIMVGPFGEVYVMDWGLARLVDAEDEPLSGPSGGSATQTMAGELVGTPAYMAPEQARGENERICPATDQYSLGLILQELATLRPAIDGEDGDVVLDRAGAGNRNNVKGVHKEIVAVINRACQLDPGRRYGSVDALSDDVRRHLLGEAPLAYREGLLGRTARALMRYREAVVIVFLVLIVGASGVAIASLVALQAQQYTSHLRENRLAAALTAVSIQAHKIDAEFQKYERILAGVGATAVLAMTDSPPESDNPPYTADDFDNEGRQPPDLAMSDKHGREVSLASPSFKLAPGVARPDVADQMARMTRLRHFMAHPSLPITWMYVGTERGLQLSYPGHGGYPEAFDPRKRPWYVLSADRRGHHWGNAYMDVNGTGLTLPCSLGLFDSDGEFLGVAGLDLTFDYIIDTLLDIEEMPNARTYLLDEFGRVVVDSQQRGSQEGGIQGNKALELKVFDVPEVVNEIEAMRSGYVYSGDELVMYYRLHALGWYYVIAGDSDDILSGGSRR